MTDAVKRTYTSQRRDSQARETRRAIVAAGARLFVAHGFGSTTIDDIAAEARVSRKTVFTSVGGKVDILKLAMDWAIVGDDEPIPLMQREAIRSAEQQTDPDVAIRTWVSVNTAAAARVGGLFSALTVAADSDEAARRLLSENLAQRRRGFGAFITLVDRLGGLRPGLSKREAVDLVVVHGDPLLFRKLVTDLGWAEERYADWLYRTMRFQLRGIGTDETTSAG